MDGVYEFKDILAEFGKVYFLGFHPWNLHPAYFIYLASSAGRRTQEGCRQRSGKFIRPS